MVGPAFYDNRNEILDSAPSAHPASGIKGASLFGSFDMPPAAAVAASIIVGRLAALGNVFDPGSWLLS